MLFNAWHTEAVLVLSLRRRFSPRSAPPKATPAGGRGDQLGGVGVGVVASADFVTVKLAVSLVTSPASFDTTTE